MVFGAAPFSGTQARDASGMWVTPGHWLLTPERSLVLVWCLHSANFAFVSPVKVSSHYKSHLRSHTSSAQSPFACAKIWESQWEAPASYATCYHNTINDWSHDNNHQTTNTDWAAPPYVATKSRNFSTWRMKQKANWYLFRRKCDRYDSVLLVLISSTDRPPSVPLWD